MKKRHLLLGGLLAFAVTAMANPVIVKMNAVSPTMTLADKETGEQIILPAPENNQYALDLKPGYYMLTGIAKDGKTVNGTIVMNVTDSVTTQQKTIITCTAYVTNKDSEGNAWTRDKGDYTLDVKVNTREGEVQTVTIGNSVTDGRYTFLAFNGNSYNVAFEPSDEHQKEGYMTLYRGGTLTANVNVTGAIPLGGDFSITIPDGAELQLGMKFTHFTDFTPVDPKSIEPSAGGTTYNYVLANGQVYNYRTWKKGGLTQGGYFTMNTDAAQCPKISFTDADYAAKSPKAINHDVKSNNGYETGDILLNINSNGHLQLKRGETFKVHAMRMWELSDNSTNNYFFEPDFHYTVIGLDGKPLTGVIEITNADTNNSAWSDIKAVGNGTAIVLVTYDGINLNYYNKTDKKDYLGGSYWGAIWPENTGAFVVTVGEEESTVKPEMIVNEQYNVGALRLAGKYADTEHDVFYYLDTEDHYNFTFKPEGAAEITMASPTLTETAASYTGFSNEGVVRNEDGSYTLKLKYGRNIIKLTDAAGRSLYRVLRAKPCHREIINLTREGSNLYQPGDKVKIQYSGLFHPANKIAGIYNMSAYVTYNGVPNGSSLILGSGQYTFGSAASAQAVTIEIPEDYNAEEKPEWVMDEGVIQVNGYGDPIGNHRNTSPTAGRSPNFTAVPHQTYFGSIPDIRIPVSPMKLFNITLTNNVEGAETELTFGDKVLAPNEAGIYSWTYGTYNVTAKKDGYRCYRKSFTIQEGADDNQIFEIVMAEGSEGMWDGNTVTAVEPDENGVYHIATGAELAYVGTVVAEKGSNFTSTVILDNDIDLGDFEWTPIGTTSSKCFSAEFDGNGHKVTGLYINQPATNNMALFGYVKGTTAQPAVIKNVSVDGFVSGKQYVGGLVATLNANASIDKCANYADITAASSYAGGVAAYMSSATVSITNSFNQGNVRGTTNVGGITGYNNASATVTNVYSTGEITGTAANSTGACVGGTTAKTKVTNLYTTRDMELQDNSMVVTEEVMASGEVAYKLGEAFSQTIGVDPAPVFNGLTVYYDEDEDTYYNLATSFRISVSEDNDDVVIGEAGLLIHPESNCILEITAEPLLGRLPNIVWSSSDETVCTVKSDETLRASVIALTTGTAIIKAQHADNPEVYDTCQITVTPATSIGTIFGNDLDGMMDIFDVTGRTLMYNVSGSELKSLTPGVYIIRYGTEEKKVLVK